jgi:predicted glycoside hydrolase/deacetylase ChbG (UPF0249 family)
VTRFLFNADDIGMSEGHTRAVERALGFGVLERVSVLANGPAFEGAMRLVRAHPQLGLGVHLTLCMGDPVLPPSEVRPLVDGAGHFPDALPAPLGTWLGRPRALEAVRREWRAQAERVLAAGVKLTHLDSHRHVHALPPLLDVSIELARELGVPYVRAPRPTVSMGGLIRRAAGLALLYPFGARALHRIRAAGLACADWLLGFDASGMISAPRLVTMLRSAPEGTVEVMLHPAERSPDLEEMAKRWPWMKSYAFEEELAALCDPEVREIARAAGASR